MLSVDERHALDAWLGNPRNKIPLHSRRQTDAGDGARVNWRLLTLLLGVHPGRQNAMFGRSVAAQRRRHKVLDVVAQGRVTTHALISDLATVTRPDGTTGPWHPGIGPRDLLRLRIGLRDAAFVLVAALSMMRDSEIQAIERHQVVEYFNSPAIASTLRKGNPDLPRKHWWIAELAAEAIAVAEAVSTHPRRVFGPMHQEAAESLDGVRMITSFTNFVNAHREWSGLDEIPPGPVHPHMFRRTMAMLTDQFAGSEIALGMQLKHIATRALANRVTRGYAAVDSAWSEHLEGAIEAARFRKLKELYGLHTNGEPIGFGAGADRVKAVFDQVAAVVKARRGDARVEEDLLRRARITIRFGTLNNCLYDGSNPTSAACLENAVVPDGHTGPLDERCRPDRCANSMIGVEHLALYDAHRRTQLKLLQTPRLPACRKELITRELERVQAVLDKAREEPT